MRKVTLENEWKPPLPSPLPQGGEGISGADLMSEHRRLGLGPTYNARRRLFSMGSIKSGR